ncbi:MAG TPA: hypothetical protein VF415_05810 [Rhodanobacter sp.]
MILAVIPDREDQSGGHPWPHFEVFLRSSVIAKIKRAAVRGRTFEVFLRSSVIAKIKRAAIHGRTFQGVALCFAM